MHDYHDALPNYDPAQILYDGCDECEQRGLSRNCGIAYLDVNNFARAWRRAAEWNRNGGLNISTAEVPMLDVLWAVQCQLEHFGVPIGTLPVAVQ